MKLILEAELQKRDASYYLEGSSLHIAIFYTYSSYISIFYKYSSIHLFRGLK